MLFRTITVYFHLANVNAIISAIIIVIIWVVILLPCCRFKAYPNVVISIDIFVHVLQFTDLGRDLLVSHTSTIAVITLRDS